MTLKKIINISAIALLGFSGTLFADSLGVNVETGVAFSQLSSSQYLSPQVGLLNAYSSNEAVQTEPFVGLGIEYDFDHLVPMPFTFGLGLSAYYVDLGAISGSQSQGVNIVNADPLDYSVDNQSLALMIEPRMVYTAYRFQPYVLGGIGCAWNNLSNYTETAPAGSNTTPADHLYSSHTEASFAYEVGAGVQYALWQGANKSVLFLRAEYRYFNLGQSQLGSAVDQNTNDRLTVNSVTNILDIGMSYQFE